MRLTKFRTNDTSNVGSACLPVVLIISVFPDVKEITHYTPFWLKLISNFSFMRLTVFISSSHMLTILPSLAPHPHVTSRIHVNFSRN